MNEYDEMRESVRAEYGATVSSKLVDDRLKETYAHLGVMAKAEKRRGHRVLKWAGSLAGGLAAAFAVMVGVSTANPAFAASIPGMESIVSVLKGGPVSSDLITKGAVDEFVQPVAAQEEKEFQITETYYDGKTLVLGLKLTLADAPEGYRQLMADFALTARADGKEISLPVEDFQTYDWRMTRRDESTFVGSLTLDTTKLDLPEAFDLTVKLGSLTAVDTKLMVLSKDNKSYGYEEKTYEVDFAPAESTCAVQADPDLQKVYAVNETQNGCTLKQVVSTPALTEIDIACEEDGIAMLAYDDEGKELTGMYKYGQESFETRYYTALKKDAKNVTVKFFRMEDRYNPVAEFVVPVEGGYAEETVTRWDSDDTPVVYDPPLPETDTNTRHRKGTEVAELGETFRDPYALLSGSMDVTFDNLRVYGSYEDAGISAEDMNLNDRMQEELDSGFSKFVLLDITLQSHDAIGDINADEESNEETRSEDCTYWISSYAYPCAVDTALMDEESGYVGTEVNYFSEHSNGLTNYYHFVMNANETKTMQIGFVVPVSQLEAGNFQIACDLGGRADLTEEEMMTSWLGSSTYQLVDIPADAVKAAMQ